MLDKASNVYSRKNLISSNKYKTNKSAILSNTKARLVEFDDARQFNITKSSDYSNKFVKLIKIVGYDGKYLDFRYLAKIVVICLLVFIILLLIITISITTAVLGILFL